MTRVVMIGDFRLPHSTPVQWARTLVDDLDVHVLPLQQDTTTYEQVMRECHDTTALIWVPTWGWPTHGLGPDEWAMLEGDFGCKTAMLTLDAFWGLELDRERIPVRHPALQMGAVFTPDGDHDPEWDRWGIAHHRVLPGVYGPDCGVVEPSRAGEFDVAFVGTVDGYHESWPYRGDLVRWLRRRYRTRFIEVPGQGEKLHGRALADLCASVPVIVGDTWAPNRERSRTWSDRPYQLIGRGAHLVMPAIAELQEEIGDLCDWYPWDNFTALGDIIDGIVHDPTPHLPAPADRAATICDRASYTVRLTEVLDTLGVPHR